MIAKIVVGIINVMMCVAAHQCVSEMMFSQQESHSPVVTYQQK